VVFAGLSPDLEQLYAVALHNNRIFAVVMDYGRYCAGFAQMLDSFARHFTRFESQINRILCHLNPIITDMVSLENMFDVSSIIQTGGLLLIALIIFGESGMFIGFFFPGDTLLLTAGVFAAQGHLSLIPTILVIALAAIAGDNTGYHIGRRYGSRLFNKPDSLIFRQEHIRQAHKFFERWGSRTMLFAHFVPVVRTFAPPVAGVAEMSYRQFFIFDAIGDCFWAASVVLVGYWFGQRIPDLDHYIVLAVAAVMLVTLGPTIYHLIKAMRKKRKN
jgi:membrane-associated protein